ncbi:MAG: HAD-IIB family hydrolase [Deltaproteobacteria bacterium]|nr:HAD-IIB family hydrolase [Deltaproteobacteria bacterium]
MVVFSDLDGTLLDARTYSFAPARPALERLTGAGARLVLCSSKTRAEMEVVRAALGNRHPFIVENGAAAFVPCGYFPFSWDAHRRQEGYDVLEWGVPYARLRRAVAAMREEGLPVTGFGDLSVSDVAGLCGFSEEEAARARQREYDEPLLIDGGVAAEERAQAVAGIRGLQLVRGGQFWHLAGPNDKGKAVAALGQLFRRRWPEARLVGLGDGDNDRPMLEAVDVPVLIPSAEGEARLRLPHLRIARDAGPVGWNQAVLELLEEVEGRSA